MSTINKDEKQIKKSNIAILTSGGDCQGMNSVLYGLTCRHLEQLSNQNDSNVVVGDVYLIYNGYQGLIDGNDGKTIIKSDKKLLKKFFYQGGTIINSSRCREFYQKNGRRKAAFNLLRLNIQNLLIIGGDGSLMGAQLLHTEWKQYFDEYNRLNNNLNTINKLNLIGIVGSIDNDFYGTDMTIGTDSALTRIVECIDQLQTTAKSHSRAMIVEVMGRNCGYLSISAALCVQATYCLIPECLQKNEWQRQLTERIQYERQNGQYYHIIIIAEGSCDQGGNRIYAKQIKDYLCQKCGIETRLIILGHLQRGGKTSSFDHLLSIKMGMMAYDLFQQNQMAGKSMILTLNNNEIRQQSMEKLMNEMYNIGRLQQEKQFQRILQEYRGKYFLNTWQNYRQLMSLPQEDNSSNKNNWAIVMSFMNNSSCYQLMPGISGIIYAIVHYGYSKNIKTYFYPNGLDDLYENRFELFQWNDIVDITSSLFTSVTSNCNKQIDEKSIDKIIDNLKSNSINCLCFIGDQCGYNNVKWLNQHRRLSKNSYLTDVKIAFIPIVTTFTNDDNNKIKWSKLGRDSILNKTLDLIHDLIQSTIMIKFHLRLFVISLDLDLILSFNQNLFDLNTFQLSVGVDGVVYNDQDNDINEETIKKILKSMTTENKYLLVHNKRFDQIRSLLIDQDKKIEIIDITSLQFPSKPSPFDRKLSIKLGMECANYFNSSDENDKKSLMINTPFIYESIEF